MSKYGIQLYSVKDFMEKGVEETLKQVAEMGYTMVEPAGYYDVSAEDFKAYCDKYGLTVCSTHNGLWTINKGNFDSTVAYLKKIGCTRFIMPNCGYDTKEKLDASIEQMNEYGPRLAAEGLELMYHNHCEEFEFNEDGVIPMVEILKRTNIKLQVDIYWIYRAGISPIYFLEQFKDRIGAVHLKDGSIAHGTPLGKGTSPIAQVVKWAKENNVLMVVENEPTPAKQMAEAKVCIDYLKSLKD